MRLSPPVGHRTWFLCGKSFELLEHVLLLKMRWDSYICKSVDRKWCFDAGRDIVLLYARRLERRTRPRGRTGVALAAELLQGVDSYVEVDVFAATALIHQLLLIKGLKQRKNRDWRTFQAVPHRPGFVPSGRQRPLMDRI